MQCGLNILEDVAQLALNSMWLGYQDSNLE